MELLIIIVSTLFQAFVLFTVTNIILIGAVVGAILYGLLKKKEQLV
ncbi:hypothetical protein [Staphylococcus felis]